MHKLIVKARKDMVSVAYEGKQPMILLPKYGDCLEVSINNFGYALVIELLSPEELAERIDRRKKNYWPEEIEGATYNG